MNQFSQWLQQLNIDSMIRMALTLVASLLCVIIHEVAHGFAAWKLGDPTAKKAGRLSLNPVRHLDWMGLLSMGIVGFGWAKPIPVNFARFENPRRDGALVALAGPASNLLLAVICLTLYSLAFWMCLHWQAGVWSTYLLFFFYYSATLNVGLAVFNLIPIPPLDGSKVALSFLPEKWY